MQQMLEGWRPREGGQGWMDLEEGQLFSSRVVSIVEDGPTCRPYSSKCVSRGVEAAVT